MTEIIGNTIKLMSNLLVNIIEIAIPIVLLIVFGWALVIIFEPIIKRIKNHFY